MPDLNGFASSAELLGLLLNDLGKHLEGLVLLSFQLGEVARDIAQNCVFRRLLGLVDSKSLHSLDLWNVYHLLGIPQ